MASYRIYGSNKERPLPRKGDHILLEETIRSEKQDMKNHVRILKSKGIPGSLAEVLNDQMTQIGLGLSKLNYLDTLKYESE